MQTPFQQSPEAGPAISAGNRPSSCVNVCNCPDDTNSQWTAHRWSETLGHKPSQVTCIFAQLAHSQSLTACSIPEIVAQSWCQACRQRQAMHSASCLQRMCLRNLNASLALCWRSCACLKCTAQKSPHLPSSNATAALSPGVSE